MNLYYEFKPEKRFCGKALSEFTPAKLTELFQEPDEINRPENSSYTEEVASYHFFSLDLTLFFNVQQLLSIAVANPAFKLFDTEVFKLRENELIELFKANGFSKHEMDADWGEKQLIFEEANVTVFFDNQVVSEIFIDV